jgi:hypothetical protein
MAFDRQPSVTPLRVGHIIVTLFDPDPTPTQPPNTPIPTQAATAEIQVAMSDGSVKTYRANIPDHFSATTVNQLKAFVASVRSKAVAEIL